MVSSQSIGAASATTYRRKFELKIKEHADHLAALSESEPNCDGRREGVKWLIAGWHECVWAEIGDESSDLPPTYVAVLLLGTDERVVRRLVDWGLVTQHRLADCTVLYQ